MANSNGNEIKDSFVTAKLSGITDWRAPLTRFTRYLAVFEIRAPEVAMRASEVLEDFKIVARGQAVYSGRAVVSNIVSSGSAATCEVALAENSWLDAGQSALKKNGRGITEEFNEFLRDWQKFYLVNQDYKVVIADIQTFLADLRLWLDQVEMKIRSAPADEQPGIELETARRLRGSVSASLASMFERFEYIASQIPPELQPVHRTFGQRQLHPYLLCAPFIHRTYAKPLGYAGDYEMMNMIWRDNYAGNSLYAKLIDGFLLDQIGPQAVRNRVDFLYDRIGRETNRVSLNGRPAKIYSIACGPAREAQNFLAESPLADFVQLHLLDFNEETLEHTRGLMEEIKRKYCRRADVKLVRNSVQNLLRGGKASESDFDLIYCSGLYDYLGDRMIKALNNYLYGLLAPGGLLVVGNFAPNTPVKNFIEHFLEWFLIYRNARQLGALAPDQAPPQNCVVSAESTATNIFLEVRKPK